jgi:hypothetical protein
LNQSVSPAVKVQFMLRLHPEGAPCDYGEIV